MADIQSTRCIDKVSGSDFTAKQYYLASIDSNGNAVLAGAGAVAFIVDNKPAVGEPASLVIEGKAKAVAGGTIAAGAKVYSDANGKLTTTASIGNTSVGIAGEAGVVNQVMEVIVSRSEKAA